MKLIANEKDSTDSAEDRRQCREGRERYLAELEALQNCDRKKLSREDKLMIQKLKNRRSAQKSRDEKKLYISQLEQKILFLERENRRLNALIDSCPTCARALRDDPVDLPQECKMETFQDPRPQEEQVWERVSVESKAESLSKFLLLLFAIGLLIAGVSPEQGRAQSEPSGFYKRMEAVHPLISYTPHRRTQTCLLQYKMGEGRLFKQSGVLNLTNERGLTPRASKQSWGQDTVVCDSPKIIRGGGLRAGDFQISSHFQLMLDGRSMREYGLVNNAWQGQLRCEYEMYRIQAEVKQVQVFPGFECFTD